MLKMTISEDAAFVPISNTKNEKQKITYKSD